MKNLSAAFIAFLAGLLFFPRLSTAQVFSSADLTAPLEEQGVSARALGLGSSYVAVPGDVAGLLFNPSLLGTVRSFQLDLDHQQWLNGFTQETLLFSFPTPSWGTGGLALDYVNLGTFDGHDANGDPSANYGSTRISATAGWGLEMVKNLYVGLSGRGLQQTTAGQSFQALALDGGILWKPFPGFYAGGSYINFGTYVDNFLLAARWQLGASYSFKADSVQSLLGALEYSQEPYNDAQLHLGVEDCLYGVLSFRAGYQWDLYQNEVSGFQGLSGGLGLRLDSLTLDYAYIPLGDLGNSQRISLRFDFGPAPKELPTKPTPMPSPVSTPTPTLPGPAASPTALVSTAASVTSTPTPQPIDPLKLYFEMPASTTPEASPTPVPPEVLKLQTQIRSNPQDSSAWYGLGHYYYENRQKTQAIQCFEQVLRLQPQAQALRDWLAKYKSTAP
jgi:tetratricopeptide (TPR) repeat protein